MHDENRRALLAAFAGGAGLVGMLPAAPAAAAAPGGLRQGLGRLLGLKDESAEEAYWGRIRDTFALKPGLIHLNSANLASSSKAVLATEAAVARDVTGDPSFENRLKFEAVLEKSRDSLARMLRADPDEIAITRNTSEGNRTVIAGLKLGPDDEVLIWDENHESNSIAWDVWAARFGFKVVRVTTPAHPENPEALAAAFISRFTPRTKLLAFSHVSNATGVALPAQRLCRAAAAQGILTLVDGAQTFGLVDLNLHELGCDFFTGSIHKWLAGPHETGVLYIRRDRIDALWPSMVTHDWDIMSKAGARKFECLGQRQYGRIAAIQAATNLRIEIGQARAEQRIRSLNHQLRTGLDQLDAGITYLAPAAAEMSAGIVKFTIKARSDLAVRATLYDKFRISAVVTGPNDQTQVRYSPNVYNTTDDIQRAVQAIAFCIGATSA